MRGPSRASLAAAREQLTAALADPSGAAALGDELFAVAHLLDQEPGLRRALTDATSPPAAREGLVSRLLDGRVSGTTLDLVAGMVRDRWAAGRDLADAAEELAVLATAASADAASQLDEVEDQLFRFGRIASADPELYAALSGPRLPVEGKRGLVETLLAGKVPQPSLRLITQAVVDPRGRSLEANLADYARLVASWRQRLIAVVRVATELTDGQRERLTAALAAIYGHGVQLNVLLDSGVVGGMSIQIGDEYIDGTLSSLLDSLRRRLAA